MKIELPRFVTALFTILIISIPVAALAQTVSNVQNLFAEALEILNDYVVPLIFGLAFIMFLYGVYKYFIAGGAEEEKVQQGQKFVLWSVVGFVLMFSIWGIINLFINTLGFDTTSRPAFPTFGSGTTGTSFITNNGSGLFGGGSSLFGSTGGSQGSLGSVGSTYTDPISGGSYQVTGPNTVQQNAAGNCPANFSQTGGNQCLSNASTGSGAVASGGACKTDGDCTGDLACNSSHVCATDPSLENGGYGQSSGNVVAGGTCKTNDDCAGNLACSDNNVCTTDGDLDGPGYGDGDGTVYQGGACEDDNDCNGGLICTNGICGTDSQLDGDGSIGSGCSTNTQCNGDSTECINGSCQADDGLGQQNEQCTSDDDCEGDLACISGSCQVDQNLDSGDGYTDPDQGGGEDDGGNVPPQGNTGS